MMYEIVNFSPKKTSLILLWLKVKDFRKTLQNSFMKFTDKHPIIPLTDWQNCKQKQNSVEFNPNFVPKFDSLLLYK